MYRIPVLSCLALLLPLGASALEASGAVGDFAYTVYGPDWCWQKRDINIMAVLENTGDAEIRAAVEVVLPEGDPAPFVTETSLAQTVHIAPGETRRIAFTEIVVSADAPRDVYELTLRFTHAGQAETVAYPVRTVRGAAVSPGVWALYLPVLLTAVWSLLIFAVLCKLGGAKAWLRPSPPVTAAEDTA